MSDSVTDQGGTHAAADWGADLPVAEVQSLFVTLGKAFRAYQLYDENNPVRQRFVESLKSEFQTVWGSIDRLKLRITEDHILLGDASVYSAESRHDSLAFLFFKDGIREIMFKPGIEETELEQFLGVLQKARKMVPEGDDLLTVLWAEELQHFEYQYVDLLAEGVALPKTGSGNTQADLSKVLQAEAGGAAAGTAGGAPGVAAEGGESEEEDGPASSQPAAAADQDGPATVSKDDFNPTLYALDPRDMEILSGEVRKEFARDLRTDVLNALFDRLEESDNRERQSEILDILTTLLPSFLSRGQLAAATAVLQELGKIERMEDVFDEQRRQESSAILDEISAPEAIDELIQALYDGTIRASPAQLSNFLLFLRGRALSPLLRASETVDHRELQVVLRKAVQGIASKHKAAVLRLLGEDDPIVASGAARLAGEMKITEAGPVLADLLAHPYPDVRLAAIEATVTLKASTAAGALQHTLDDPDRDVRIGAARALAELRYRPAAQILAEIVKGKEIKTADISEKVAFFEAYGMVAQEDGIDLLDRMLNGKGFLGKREPAEVRAAAALGLGQIAGNHARAVLQKASADDDPVVRSNVSRALRNEE